jgi:microcystin-dependent protein
MAIPYVGEIRMFGGNFAPNGWALCDGQLLPISENETLFQLIGTTYGGDGQSTFGLPDLRGRVPVHQGGGLVMGQLGGTETVTLTATQAPAHTHSLNASGTAATPAAGPTGVLGASATTSFYGAGPATTPMAASALASTGGTQPHENMAPFQAVTFIISLFGIFPSPT